MQRFGRDAKCTAQAVQFRGTVLRFAISLIRHVRVCAGTGFPPPQAIYHTAQGGGMRQLGRRLRVLVRAIVCFCIRCAAFSALETDIWIKQAKCRLSVLSCCSKTDARYRGDGGGGCSSYTTLCVPHVASRA